MNTHLILPHVFLATFFSDKTLKLISIIIIIIGLPLTIYSWFTPLGTVLEYVNTGAFISFLILALAVKEKEVIDLKKQLEKK